ncbi:GNAT family N-acetyltransferase [bacterium]|nr:GNAT family N-acetyltransferase [candidate division CSSED10-310 bacterium]
MALELRKAYWDDPESRSAFKNFMRNIHGLDFTDWEAAGYWDDDYMPFSYFEGDRIIASVCLYFLDVVIDGQQMRTVQISGVGTLPEWRCRGLNRRLTEAALEWAEGKHTGIFLFSDTEAIPFYSKCGFTPIDEYVEMCDAPACAGCQSAVKLDPAKPADRDRIFALASRRTAVSDRFGVLNPKLLMFHALYMLPNDIYAIPDLGCIVFYRRTADRLMIFDIIGERMPLLKDLYPCISHQNDRYLEFHFHTDKLGLTNTSFEMLAGNNPFVRGVFSNSRPVFPFTFRA